MRNLAFEVIDRLFLVVYGTASPTQEEWGEYLAAVARHGVDRTMQLVVTDGGEPTSAQRRELNELLDGRTVPVAVVSNNPRVRRAVTVHSWFNRKLKAFPPSELHEAIAHLEVPVNRSEIIEAKLNKLRAATRTP